MQHLKMNKRWMQLPVVLVMLSLAACNHTDHELFNPGAFCSSNPSPVTSCGDFEDSTCVVNMPADTCMSYQSYTLNDSSYNGSRCLFATACDTIQTFPAAAVNLSSICDNIYKIKFHYKVNSTADSAYLQILGLADGAGQFSMANYSIHSADYNSWQIDSIVTASLPVTTDHKVELMFIFTGRNFYLDDVTTEIVE